MCSKETIYVIWSVVPKMGQSAVPLILKNEMKKKVGRIKIHTGF